MELIKAHLGVLIFEERQIVDATVPAGDEPSARSVNGWREEEGREEGTH